MLNILHRSFIASGYASHAPFLVIMIPVGESVTLSSIAKKKHGAALSSSPWWPTWQLCFPAHWRSSSLWKTAPRFVNTAIESASADKAGTQAGMGVEVWQVWWDYRTSTIFHPLEFTCLFWAARKSGKKPLGLQLVFFWEGIGMFLVTAPNGCWSWWFQSWNWGTRFAIRHEQWEIC